LERPAKEGWGKKNKNGGINWKRKKESLRGKEK